MLSPFAAWEPLLCSLPSAFGCEQVSATTGLRNVLPIACTPLIFYCSFLTAFIPSVLWEGFRLSLCLCCFCPTCRTGWEIQFTPVLKSSFQSDFWTQGFLAYLLVHFLEQLFLGEFEIKKFTPFDYLLLTIPYPHLMRLSWDAAGSHRQDQCWMAGWETVVSGFRVTSVCCLAAMLRKLPFRKMLPIFM